MAKLAATIGAHIAVNSGDAALGGDPVEVVFSALSVPPTLVLPPGGLALTSITGFIEALFEGDGHFAGSGLGKGSFPSEVLALKDVYLTQFELDVSDELAPATFLLGLEYETAWPLPGVSDLPGFAGLQLANPGIVLQSFGPRVELYGTLEIQGVNVLASVSWPQVQLSASLLPPSVLSSPSSSQLLSPSQSATDNKTVTGYRLGSLLAGLGLGGSSFDDLTIDTLTLSADLDQKVYTFSIGSDQPWAVPLVPNLSVNNFYLELVHADGESSGSVRGQISLTTCGLDITLMASFQNGALEFSGSTGPGQKIPIGDLIADLIKLFGVDSKLPDSLLGLSISNLSLTCDSGGAFAFGCEAEFPVDGRCVDITVSIAITPDAAPDAAHETGKRTYTKTFSGLIVIGDMVFDLEFDSRTPGADAGPTNTFVALFETADKVNFSDLVGSLTSNKELRALVPDSLELGLNYAAFAYRSQADQPSEYLFGLSLDLTGAQLHLNRLPVVGGEFKDSDNAGLLDLQILLTNHELLRPQVAAFNDVFSRSLTPANSPTARPQLSLPTADPAADATDKNPIYGRGLNIAATLSLGPAGTFPLFSGARTPKPPAAKASPAAVTPITTDAKEKPPPVVITAGAAPVQRVQPPSSADDATWFDVHTSLGPVRIDKIGARYKDSRLWLLLSGSLSAGPLSLELLGLGLGFQLTALEAPDFSLDGLGLSYASGPMQISGAFFKSTKKDDAGVEIVEYAGEVTVQAETFSILAFGSYSKPASGDPSLFIYGTLSAAAGKGISVGPITITAISLGFGINQRVLVPQIEGVHDFPLVQMAMGATQGKTESLAAIHDQLSGVIQTEQGQFFGALGLRFTLFQTIECFALAIVQGGNDLEISILGVGRFERPLCSIELDILIDIKPSTGLLKVEAQLANSWVLDANCHLTGNFALYIWSGGEHKGDFVVTLGGYHKDFVAPAHYPVVPRLALTWQVRSDISINGELYFAITPSAFMAGGRLEASYRSGDIGADFVAVVDVLIKWKPLHYDVNVGISISAWIDLGFLGTFRQSLSVQLHLQGPPLHGTATVEYGPLHVTIEFGDWSTAPKPIIAAWPEFGRSFLDRVDANGKAADASSGVADDKWAVPVSVPVPGPNLHQLHLVKGQIAQLAASQNMNASDGPWRVRGDELEFSVSWVIPASTLHVGLASARTGTTGIELPVPPVGTPAGQPLTIAEALAEVLHVDEQPTAPSSLGLRLMGVDAVDTPLHVAVLRAIVSDHGPQLWEDATVGWTFELDSTNIPAALWGKAVSDTVAKQPSAESINSLTGLQHLKPPAAHTNGQPLVIDSTALGWDDLTHKSVPMDTQAQPGPIWHAGQEDILALLPTKAVKRHGIAQALVLAGFEEAAHFAIAVDAFRPLYAEPLSPAL